MRFLLTIVLLACYTILYGQVNITKLEYFIDTDPGIGSATEVPITDGPTIDVNFIVPSGLPVGFHTLVVRTQDANLVWSVQDSRFFYVGASDLTTTANIVTMEYFIDTDPGYGGGTSIPVAAATSLDISPVISTSALLAGYHTLYIRALDSDGVWGVMDSRTFFIDAFGGAQIAGIEYFIDTDPGYGSGSLIDVTPAQDTIDRAVTIPMSALTAGTYTVGMRIVDVNGNMGVTDYVDVTLCDAATVDFTADVVCAGNITSFTDISSSIVGDIYNWDFDSDGTIDDNTTGDVTFTYPSAGTYTAILEIDRAGCVVSKSVTVDVGTLPTSSAGPDQNICIDNTALAAQTLLVGETGQWVVLSGTGTFSLATDPASNVTGLTSGLNEFQWEVTDLSGTCTTTDIVGITYLVVSTADAGVDQAVCIDNTIFTAVTPSVGDTGQWTLVSGSGTLSDSTDPNSSVTGLTTGINEFQWEVTDGSGTCTSTDLVQLNYIITTAANAGSDQSLCTDNTTMGGNAPQVGETGLWSVVTGTGTFASLNDPLSAVTGLTPGLNEFNWGITDGTGTCMANDLVQINYITVTTADAGADQSICSDNTVMAGNSLQVGETGTWSLVTGSAVLTDVNDPLSTISNITTSTVDLQWTITDGLGLCTSSDVVTISANLPITAAGTSQTVSIGETAVIDVQSLATINGGDILTTIITTAPTKGTAIVLADGTIEYIPNSGVLGADIIDFQLCNQCGNCDNASILIDIPNDPPTITSEPVIVAPGTLSVSLDLSALVGDINNNADLNTLQIVSQPISGAVASIDANFNLIIDYTGITFSGTDEVSIEICDTQGECTVSILFFVVNVSAEEAPPITVYNAVSPNGDGKHDFLKIINIEFYIGNEVFIYDKIGNLVFRMLGYNNLDNIFEGIATEGNERELANGTYYYFIQLNSDQSESGFLLLQK